MTRHSLKYRLLASIVLTTTLTAILFGLLSFVFAYYIEDSFFDRLLLDEAERLSQDSSLTPTSSPSLPVFLLYQQQSELPSEVLDILEREPERKEIGIRDGRHFHLKRLDDGRILLAEVSDYLVVRHIKADMLDFLLIFLALVVLISLWVALSTANRLLRPLSRLTKTLHSMPDNPPEQGFSNGYPNNEIGLLARTLDQQMQRIQAFIQREQQFTRDISHELRTPVTVFQGTVTLLQQTPLDPRQRELVERLDANQHRMQQCLHALLALAREENLHAQPLDLLAGIEQALLPQLPTLEQQNRAVELNVPRGTKVCLPQAVLSMLLDNLINNAVSHGQGQLDIHLAGQQLTVANQGPGIAPELQSSLFEPGMKGELSQGLGMGLSIVKRLCQRYHIGLNCQSDDQGTQVRLDLSAVLQQD